MRTYDFDDISAAAAFAMSDGGGTSGDPPTQNSDTQGSGAPHAPSGNGSDNTEYEDVCYMCRRSERTAGPLIRMGHGLCICRDCMQKTFDAFQSGNVPAFSGLKMEDISKLSEKLSGLNLAEMTGITGIPEKQRVKKKSDKPAERPVFDRKKIPAPHVLKAQLDEYVVGQERAKKAISVAVYNHYKRIAADPSDGVEIRKSNLLLIGPTGSGKTYLVQTLARLLGVPLAIADATSLTEAGYIGDDIESVLSKLLAAADNDVERCEQGIVFIDEIDKIAKKQNMNSRDVSGESVQQELLKLLEGSRVEVPVGSGSKNAMVPMTTVDTTNILFICGGAFPDLAEIVRKRISSKNGIGFGSELHEELNEGQLLEKVTVEDLRRFGMIPEFLGRLPVVVSLEELDEEFLVRILKEPKNAILRQYEKLLAMDEVKLEFTEGALKVIAHRAMEKKTGARALRAILEEFMMDVMYEIPKDDNIGRVTITEEYLEGKGAPLIEMRGTF